MKLKEIKSEIPKELFEIIDKEIKELRPAQIKSIKAGLLNKKNLMVCTPTASSQRMLNS